ncbi:EamA family transporter [Francisella sp. 19X1-34]|uniref:DMT family transporter n=1 Tax=Francisella sp. 19X1-34 TaxID=3087177 RepID=UPI002E33661E|nr:EamA family transporter [Francisella sp. 19X1-34]MED7788420.1 EamA family transporter [Francisella sp. 19X1-34]
MSQSLPEQHPIKGASLALITFFLLALTGVAVKFIGSSLSTWAIVFCQNVICLILLLPSLKSHKQVISLKTNRYGLLFIRALAGVLTYFFAFMAMKTIPLVNAILLWNTAPLWVPFILLLILKVRLPWYAIISAIIGFIGIIFTLHPESSSFNIIGSIYAIIGGFLFAVTMVANRQLIHTEPHLRILFY